MIVERFAPSPTGLLHLGHAFSALTAYDAAEAAGGRFLLRIEDIDSARCKPEFVDGIYEDLQWLGIEWEEPVVFQSDRLTAYQTAVAQLTEMGLTFACNCTRKDIAAALSAPQEGADAQFGPDSMIYPGTCRGRKSAGASDAIRLDMQRAVAAIDWSTPVEYVEVGLNAGRKVVSQTDLIHHCGDIVLARKDIGTSYHVAVVVDDASQGVTHVTRGADMAPATAIHAVLQRLLSLKTPIYRHHALVRDDAGKRLAKRHDALAIRALRRQGWSANDVRNAAISSV